MFKVAVRFKILASIAFFVVFSSVFCCEAKTPESPWQVSIDNKNNTDAIISISGPNMAAEYKVAKNSKKSISIKDGPITQLQCYLNVISNYDEPNYTVFLTNKSGIPSEGQYIYSGTSGNKHDISKCKNDSSAGRWCYISGGKYYLASLDVGD